MTVATIQSNITQTTQPQINQSVTIKPEVKKIPYDIKNYNILFKLPFFNDKKPLYPRKTLQGWPEAKTW